MARNSGFTYDTKAVCSSIPKDELPKDGMPRDVAAQLMGDEMLLDGTPRLNLASFVTTSMESEAEELMNMAAHKNIIDLDSYPVVKKMSKRCVNMLARLYHAPLQQGQEGTGTDAVGSTEAMMLAVLAMKWKWRDQMRKQGKPIDKPNLVFGANVQLCWHKVCKYFDIEERAANVSEDCLVLTAERARPLIDENTIGVCPMFGSTFNGEYEDVKAIHDMVVELNEKNGWQVPLHVDAASGGFVAPFLHPDVEWDFRLPNVKSINVSGHKFGLVYAGIGWALWREPQDLPEDLVFHVNYLGGDQASFTLNFSKGSGNVVGQYYNFLRLGFQGYKQVMQHCQANAEYVRDRLRKTGKVVIVDKGHIPCIALALKDPSKYTVFDLQDKVRNRGWIVPAYTCPPGASELAILRVVVREDFSQDIADMLIADMIQAMDDLQKGGPTAHALKQQDLIKRHKQEAAHDKAQQEILQRHEIHHMGHAAEHRQNLDKTLGVC